MKPGGLPVAAMGSSLAFCAGLALYLSQHDPAWLLIMPATILLLVSVYSGQWIFLLLLCTLPFSFEYHFSNGWSTDIPAEFLMLWTGVLSLFILASKTGTRTQPFRIHPLVMILLAWMAWILLTVAFSTEPLFSLKYLAAKTWYIAAFAFPFLAWNSDQFVRRALTLLLFAMTASVLIVLFNHAQTSFRFSTVNEAVRPFFRNHVNYSAMLVCLLPPAWFVYRQSTERVCKMLLVLVIALLLFALAVSYARGAWLALGAGLVAIWLIKKRILVLAYLSAIVLTLAALLWLRSGERYLQFAPHFRETIFHEDFGQHLVATYKLKDLSSAERYYRWIAGVRMAAEHPLAGTGPNTFYPAYMSYTIPLYKTWVSDNPERSGVHNYFLLLAIEQGLPGLLIFLLLVGLVLHFLQKGYHYYRSNFHRHLAAMGGVMMVMILVVNFLSDLIETDKVGSLFFLLIGLVLYLEKREGEVQSLERSNIKADRILGTKL